MRSSSMPRTVLTQYISPGANIDSNFSDFVAYPHRVFRSARKLEALIYNSAGKSGQNRRVIYYRPRIDLPDGNRAIKLAVCAGQCGIGFYAEVNPGRAALCAAVTPVMGGIYWRKARRIRAAAITAA